MANWQQMRRVLVGFRCATGQFTASRGLNLGSGPEMPLPMAAVNNLLLLHRRHNSSSSSRASSTRPGESAGSSNSSSADQPDKGEEEEEDVSSSSGEEEEPDWEPTAKQRRNLVWMRFYAAQEDIPRFLPKRAFRAYTNRWASTLFPLYVPLGLLLIYFLAVSTFKKKRRRKQQLYKYDKLPVEMQKTLAEVERRRSRRY